MRVEAGRDEQQLGLERRDRRPRPARTPRGSPRRRCRRRAAGCSSVSPCSPGPAGARVERPLVERDEEDRRVVADDRLGAVAVVDVPVEDRDPPDAELGLRPARRDRDRVEEAEAHRAARLGVVPGRPREREAAAARRLDRRAGGEQRRLEGRRGADRVGVEPARRARARARRAPRVWQRRTSSSARAARTRRTGSARAAPRSGPATPGGRRSDGAARSRDG